jgi:hypothetical protein
LSGEVADELGVSRVRREERLSLAELEIDV